MHALIAVLLASALPGVQLDLGGQTFDFKSRSDELFHIPMPGDEGNFVTAGEWKPGESKKADGARIRTWSRVVPLPSKEGGTFTVSFRYKSRHSDLEKSYILVYFRNRKAGTDEWEEARGFASNGGSYYGWPLTDDFADWNVYTKTFGVKPGCEALELVFRTDGAGELEFKDVGLAVAKDEAATERLTLSPHGLLDGRFEVSEGQCGAIGFNWKHDEKKPYDRARTTFRLTLPRGFDFLGTSFGDPKTIRTDRKPDGSSVTEFTAGLGFEPRWANFCRMTALVKSTAVAGTEGKARLEAMADGRPVATAAEFVLATSPAISVRLPKRFMNGVFPSGTSVFFGGGAADRAFAEFMAACGVQWLVTDKCTRDLVDVWHAAGIRRVTPEITMSNGYFMGGDIALRPEADRFRFGPTDEDWRMGHDSYISRGMCPLAIIEERPFFVTNCVAKSIDARMCGADGAWANWEPYMFATRGCICERCRAAFAEWSAKTGGTLKDFRSLQHAKVMRTIDKYVRRTPGGGSLGFIPGVSWRELCSRWREDPPSPESKAQDYAGSLGWINPWGPYFGWNPESPYAYRKNGALAHFVAAKDIREQVDRDFAPGARPKLLSFPHGLQGSDWVTQPEHLAMALDSFFFNRWDANVIYFFPQGYDARYWRAFAGSVTRTAKFEDFVIDGRRIDERVTLEPVAEYAAPCSVVTTYLPQYRDVSPLQHAAYVLKGRMIVAAFNFWDKGEAFFSLKVEGLKEGSYEIVDEEGLRYSKSETEPGWSKADLVRGVRLVVGAARTRVFTLAPVGTQKAVSTLSAATLEDLYAARKPRLSAVAAADRRYEAANRVTKDTQAEL